MKILIHCVHYPIASGRYAVDAFKRLGHDVRHIGQETGNNIWGIQVDPKYAWSQEPPEWGWEPDLCILMDTAYQWHHPTVPTVLWTVDNHVRNTRQPGIIHYFLAHHEGPAQPVLQLDETWLPCAHDPVAFKASPIPYEDRQFDVALMGVIYQNRAEVLDKLQKAGVKVVAGAGALYDQYAAYYHNARISLCISIAGDVAQRIFETAALGCLVVSDNCADFARLNPRGVMICDMDNIVQEVKIALAHPEMAEREIVASRYWVKSHTWQNRAQTIIDWYESQKEAHERTATP